MALSIDVVSDISGSGLGGSSFVDIVFLDWSINDPNANSLNYLAYDHTDIYAQIWTTDTRPPDFRNGEFVARSKDNSVISRIDVSNFMGSAGRKTRFWGVPYNKSGGAGNFFPSDGFDIDLTAGYRISGLALLQPLFTEMVSSARTLGGPAIKAVDGPVVLTAKPLVGGNQSQLSFPAMTGTPSSAQNGDVWFDGTSFKTKVGGVVKTFTLT